MKADVWSYPLRSRPPSKGGECESYEDQPELVGVSGEFVNIVGFVDCAILWRVSGVQAQGTSPGGSKVQSR